MPKPEHLGGDRWRVRPYVGTGRNARQISRSFRANGERAATRKAPAVEAALRAEYESGALKPGSIAELVDDWLQVKERKGLSPSTLSVYRIRARRISEWFGKMEAAQLDGKTVDKWYSELKAEGMSSKSIRHYGDVLRNVLTFGHTKRDLPIVATVRATLPEYRQADIVTPTNPEAKRLMGLMSECGEWGRCVQMILLTGMRRGEVVGLRWEDWAGNRIAVRHSIVKPGRELVVKEPKGKRARLIAIGAGGSEVLQAQRDYVDGIGVSPWVFPDWRADVDGSQPRSPGSLGLAWSRWRGAHGFESINLHHLRHWYATAALDAGVPLPAVSAQLGHADTSTTLNIYAKPTDDGRDRAAEEIDGLLKLDKP